VPVGDLLGRGSEFFDDHSFGSPGEGIQFNEEGLRAFCGTIRLPFGVLTAIERPGLATDLLNDLVRTQETQEQLRRQQFVLDEEAATIIGMVSRTYQPYSNRQVLDDMRTFLSKTGSEESEVKFQSAFAVNTRLRFRVLKSIRHGQVAGWGGEGPDESRIGLQVTNSMVGDTAVSIHFFIERLIRANGLIAPVSHTENRVFHSGLSESFAKRLDSKVKSVLAGANGVLKMLTELSDLSFVPEDLAKAHFTADILDIVPAARTDLKGAAKGMRFGKDVLPPERKWRREAKMIEAKELPVPEQVLAEERAGALADRIAKNQRKFRRLDSTAEPIDKDFES